METQYSRRVRELEAQGLTTSDAQGVADTEGLDDVRITTDAKPMIIAAIRVFLATRPRFELGNYSDAASYRADVRRATQQRHDAECFLRDVEQRYSITAEDILREASGGRVDITRVRHWECGCGHKYTAPVTTGTSTANLSGEATAWCPRCNKRPQIGSPVAIRIHYTAGQYYCTEYRGAVARLLASVLWAWKRDHAMPAPDLVRANGDGPQCEVYPGGISAGDWLRASFRREYGRGIASRYFS